MTSKLAHFLCSEFPWDGYLCWQNCNLLRRWDGAEGSVGQGAFSVSHDTESQSGILLILKQQLSQLSWKKNIHITLLAYLKVWDSIAITSTLCFKQKLQLSSSIKSTYTVYSQYLYKELPAYKQTNHISTLPYKNALKSNEWRNQGKDKK